MYTKSYLFSTHSIDLKSLLRIMKFVYHYDDSNDLKRLYKDVQYSALMLPLKPLNLVQNTTRQFRPIAVSDYVQNNNPAIPLNFNTRPVFEKVSLETDFQPIITDLDICSSYNAPKTTEIFHEEAVADFHDVFEAQVSHTNTMSEGGKYYGFHSTSKAKSLQFFRPSMRLTSINKGIPRMKLLASPSAS